MLFVVFLLLLSVFNGLFFVIYKCNLMIVVSEIVILYSYNLSFDQIVSSVFFILYYSICTL